MASVSLSRHRKALWLSQGHPHLNVEIADGSFVVLVGPSGCGKTTTLNMIAGLEPITAGRLLIGARDVTDLPPKNRDIAMVFQSYALFPHMTVFDNIAFGHEDTAASPSARSGRRCARSPATAHRRVSRPPAEGPIWRTTPARRARSRARSASGRVPDGRTALQPRRQIAHRGAQLSHQDASRDRERRRSMSLTTSRKR